MCSPTAVTEVTGREMICVAGLCSTQASLVESGETGSGQAVLGILFCHIYTEHNCEGHTKLIVGVMKYQLLNYLNCFKLGYTFQCAMSHR
jgi:hypothetical protein